MGAYLAQQVVRDATFHQLGIGLELFCGALDLVVLKAHHLG
jgi:hypothetical protein